MSPLELLEAIATLDDDWTEYTLWDLRKVVNEYKAAAREVLQAEKDRDHPAATLLAACKAVESILDGRQPKDIPGAVMVVRAAIAKATA